MSHKLDYCRSCRKHTANADEVVELYTDSRGVEFNARRSTCVECGGKKYRRIASPKHALAIEDHPPSDVPTDLPEPLDACIFCHQKTENIDDKIVVIVDKNGREIYGRRSTCGVCGKKKFRKIKRPRESESPTSSDDSLSVSSPSELLERFKDLAL